MPGRNGTGPMGAGPMTGRGFGICGGNNMYGFNNDYRKYEMHRWGCGQGRGGMRRCWSQGAGTDKEQLTREKEILQKRIDEIDSRLGGM